MSGGLINMEIHELPPKVYCKWMVGQGRWARIGVQGDGSCFFHSVCSLLNEEDYLMQTPERQREIAYAFRCKLRKNFTHEEYGIGMSLENYQTKCKDFCTPKVWADEIMIRFASRQVNLNLIFLDMMNGQAYCGVHGKETLNGLQKLDKVRQQTGLVAWVEHRHFEPIVRIESIGEIFGEISTLFNTQEDYDTVYAIMSEYVKGCKL